MMFISRYIKSLREKIKEQKGVFFLFTLLRIMVIIALVRSILIHNYENSITCVLVLILFFVPSFLEDKLKVKLPALFEAIIYCFIFAAEILGEVDHYYTLIPIWDTVLHTLNGFLFAAVGFSTIYIMNRNSKNINLSPFYLVMVAFCFSMTIGVLWEFFECGADLFLGSDMQKDFIVDTFHSCKLDPENNQAAILVEDVTETIIKTSSGKTFKVSGGYLDIGILDTMKDLLVNLIGAVVFSIFGYVYLKFGEKDKVSNAVVKGLTVQPDYEDKKKEIKPKTTKKKKKKK